MVLTVGVTVGAIICAVSIVAGMPWRVIIVLSVLWTIASVGMGMTYLDTLNTLFEEPQEPDGLSLEQVAAASVIAEGCSQLHLRRPLHRGNRRALRGE